MKNKPPFLLHLLSILYLLASLVCLFGIIQTISSWNWLLAVKYQPHPVYNVFENAFLMLAFLTSAVVLWMRKPLAPALCQSVLLAAAVWYWIDRLLINQSRLPFNEQLFPVLATLLILGLLLGSLFLLKPYMNAPASLPITGEQDENSTP